MAKKASEGPPRISMHLYLGEDLLNRLTVLAKQERRSVSNLAAVAIEIGLRELEPRQKESVHD